MSVFCLKCNVAVGVGDSAESPEEKDPIAVGDEDLTATTSSDTPKDSSLSWDKDKYQQFLLDVLHIQIPTSLTPMTELSENNNGHNNEAGTSASAGENSSSSGDPTTTTEDPLLIVSEEFPFCSPCKKEIEELYNLHLEMKQITSRFEESRNKLAATIVDTFFQQCEMMDAEPVFKGKLKSSAEVYEKWRHRYTGKEEEEFRMKYLLEEKDFEVVQRERKLRRVNDDNSDKGIFGNFVIQKPYGLTAMQLAKIQRAMTVSYFTPKMSVIRKRNRLYFRVGVKPPKPDVHHICKRCSLEFLSLDTLNVHMRRHAKTVRARRRKHTENLPYKCNVCQNGEGFKDYKDLRKHKLAAHPEVSRPDQIQIACEFCRTKFDSVEALKVHTSKVHERYKCHVCNKVFKLGDHLKRHLHVHDTGEKPYKCNVCQNDERYKDSKDLRRHKIEKHPELSRPDQIPCEFCWNKFENADALKIHIAKIHERYKCHVCNRVFKLGDHLKRHLYIHTGEKPYKCGLCTKSFNQESNLKEHMYRHTGIRPHKCPHCDSKGYLRRVHLKEHMMKEHGTDVIPLLPMGRASQNARKAGHHPVPDPATTATEPASDTSIVFNPPTKKVKSDVPIIISTAGSQWWTLQSFLNNDSTQTAHPIMDTMKVE